MFKVGQKVVFIGYNNMYSTSPECIYTQDPIKGKIYTVNYISEYMVFQYIGLEEMQQDDEFLSLCFREVDETFATEVLEQIKEQIEQEELVTI